MAKDHPIVSIPPELFAANAKSIRARIAEIAFCKLIGSELDELGPGTCTASVARRPELLQYLGMFHGGVTAYLIDHATTVAAATIVRPGQAVLTAEYKLNLLTPATGERLLCRARVIKPGNKMIVVAADVFSLADGVEKHTAAALATIAVVEAEKLSVATG
ncbi:MAG: PaaI family thioesterase [Rhizobiales bacterium]|nr:PaaI family thioesterase [Hyphomicrobiales bacterium]